MEKYLKEINKSETSKRQFEKFSKDSEIIELSKNFEISQEELFIGYYRAMQMWLLKEDAYTFLELAIVLGKVKAIKILQKNLGVKKDGIFGPVTRANLESIDTYKFGLETSSIMYLILLVWKRLKAKV